jgi:hypothetical protein
MPRSPTVLTPPPGTLPFVPNTTIESGKANAVWLDLYQDGNTPRPIVYGGTGASNAADALNNLGAIGQSNYLAAFSIGDGFYSARNISAEGGVWLKRDGSLYDSATYPVLADLMPALPDGVEWTSSNVFSSGDSRSIINTPTGFMFVNDDGTNSKVYASTDGEAWSQVATINSFRAYSVSYGGGIYTIVDGLGKASFSNDGITWSAPAAINTFTGIGGSAYGSSLFVAVGDSGKISTSPDGATWTARTSGVSVFLFNVRYLNNLFVAMGASGTVLSSPDGITWTIRTTGVSVTLYDAMYDGSMYVFVGGNGTIITTTNLTSWTPRTSGTTSDLRSIAYSSAGYITVGASGVARISNNGTAWTASPTGVSNILYCVIVSASNPAQYYAVGTSFLSGLRTLPTQFRVPNDSPQYGWIKAKND